MIAAHALGVQFLFDRQARAVSQTTARLRRIQSRVWGIRDITFTIRPGEGVALIGPSGSGKTTLLRVLAGVYEPDAGRLEVQGRVGALLSVEAGLLGPLTGRENAFHLSVLAGLSRRAAQARLEDIKRLSGLGEYFERPVASFSQGMRARLGFAVAEQTGAAILLLDEVHEALDHEFREILARRARRLLQSGGVVVAAGHDHPLLEHLCQRAIYLREGTIRADGPFTEVRARYLEEAHTAK
jgi:ABC-type polysaccharide/polyol phosphate transport system ATPase subunit